LQQFYIPFTFSTGRGYSKSCKDFISKYCNLDDILHFVLEHPTFSPAQSTIFSSTCSSLKLFNWNGKLGQLLSPLFADITDVLDPSIFSLYKKLYKYKKSIYLTECSFTNIDLFRPNFPKKKQIVFLGRFSPEKQILTFCKSIPLIDQLLKSHMHNYSFLIIGNGPLLNDLKSIMASNSFLNINVTLINTYKPHVYLNDSEIFVSLQRFNNYPSKSLIEAIAAGNLIIATDCGQTNTLAKHEFTRYIPEKFKPADIAKAALLLCELDDITKTEMAMIGRK
jgi:glycosyltransferase involved in cell wall biosynthesis